MMGRRRWWMLGGLAGAIAGVYHFVAPDADRTACGKLLPIALLKLCDDTAADQRRKRCEDCVRARGAV